MGMPYAFFNAGYILGALCLGIVSVMALFTALWLPDVMARAEALTKKDELLFLEDNAVGHEITDRKFEVNQLVNLFMGLNARRFYDFLCAIYFIGSLWSYASVFASSVASNVPVSFLNGGSYCDVYKDHSSSCSSVYLFWLLIFALIVVPLTCMDLTEMAWMQVTLAIFRFVSLGTMIITSLIGIGSYPNSELSSDVSRTSAPYLSDAPAFDWTGLRVAFPIAIYSQVFHHSIPILAQPMTNKKAIPKIFTGVLSTTFFLYSFLGVVVALYYGSAVQQTCTLNWNHYTGSSSPDRPGFASFISYLVVLFPALDVISAFPLNAITLGNGMCTAFTSSPGQSHAPIAPPKRVLLIFRLCAAIPPLIGAALVKDLAPVLQYTGCVGVLLAFVFPTVLCWVSQQRAKVLFEGRSTLPSFLPAWISSKWALGTVFGFSCFGLVAVIVLSFV